MDCEYNNMRWRRSESWLFVALAVILLASCGFQLRGQARLPFRTIYVEAGESVGADLKRALTTNGVQVRDDPTQAEVVLKILGDARKKHILAISGGGRVREYRLESKVTYQVDRPSGENVLKPAEILITRDYSYDDTIILAKEAEEQLLWRDIQNDTVQQILIRLSHAKL
jgi:LPS-assembly lipoprotein